MNREATKNQRKSELLATIKNNQQSLYHELNISSDRIVDFGKNMAAIGGILYVGYTILDRYLDAKLRTEKKKKEPGNFEALNKIIGPILAMALQQGSMLLLKKARIVLIDYLEENKKQDV